MSGLHVIQNDAGDYFVGFDADGTFVSIASVSAVRVTQLQERAAGLAELAKAGDHGSTERHKQAAFGLPYEVPGKGKATPTAGTKGGDS